MKTYYVKITKEALSDMGVIYEYIAEMLNAPKAAMEQYNHIAKKIEDLAQFPERIKIMDMEPWHSRKLRQMRVDNYAVFFIISENTVIVTNVLYGASDIAERLDSERI